MKKKIFLCICLVSIIFITGCSIFKDAKKVKGKVEDVIEKIPLMQFSDFKNIVIDKIKSIDLIKYTEAGRSEENITDKEEIKKIYNSLKSKKVGNEVTTACEDNTTIYTFNMSDNKKINVEIECDWLVIGNKRYEIK